MGPTLNKDVNKSLEPLLAAGWTCSQKGKHVKLYSPDDPDRFLVLSRTPSDRRALRNIQRSIRVICGDEYNARSL